MMVAEIEIFRQNSGHSFTSAKNWILRLTGSKDSILVQTLRSSLVSKKGNMRLFTRNKEANKLEIMWCTPFALESKQSISSNIDTPSWSTKRLMSRSIVGRIIKKYLFKHRLKQTIGFSQRNMRAQLLTT